MPGLLPARGGLHGHGLADLEDHGALVVLDQDGVALAVAALEDPERELVHELLLDDPLERARAVDGVVPQVAEQLARGVEVELSDEAKSLIAGMGYDPTYGARPLKRVIQKQLVDRLALKLLEGEFAPGDRILVDADGSELTFTRTDVPAAAAAAA